MLNERRKIIKREGTYVNVCYPDGTMTETKALIGRASSQFNSMISLEAHRKGFFLPELNVSGGAVIKNTISNENLIAVATYVDVIRNKVSATVAHMLVCNAVMDIYSVQKKADMNGKIKTIEALSYGDVPVFLLKVNKDVKQYDPGMFENSEYLIFSPLQSINTLDKVVIRVGGSRMNLKALTIDTTTYDGIGIIQVKTETRV